MTYDTYISFTFNNKRMCFARMILICVYHILVCLQSGLCNFEFPRHGAGMFPKRNKGCKSRVNNGLPNDTALHSPTLVRYRTSIDDFPKHHAPPTTSSFFTTHIQPLYCFCSLVLFALIATALRHGCLPISTVLPNLTGGMAGFLTFVTRYSVPSP